MKEPQIKCLDCKFWETKDCVVGECRFFPPDGYLTEGNVVGRWPLTKNTGWCGKAKD